MGRINAAPRERLESIIYCMCRSYPHILNLFFMNCHHFLNCHKLVFFGVGGVISYTQRIKQIRNGEMIYMTFTEYLKQEMCNRI